jgi:RNA polymerase sigma-70 factor (ECF subfamily)
VVHANTTFDPEPWRGEILAFVRRMGAGDVAEDLVQETFVRALAHPPRSEPRAYVYRIALNLVRRHRRSERSASRALPAWIDRRRGSAAAPVDPALTAERREMAMRALEAIERLSGRQRAALLLRHRRHMDYDEIARVLSCSAATARQHVHLALKAVRHDLAEKER